MTKDLESEMKFDDEFEEMKYQAYKARLIEELQLYIPETKEQYEDWKNRMVVKK